MANLLDEMTGPVNEEGRDVNVIEKQIPVKVGIGSKIFEIFLWILIIPGIIFACMKASAGNYFRALEQRIQRNASTIDNYLENRVQVLSNCASLVNKAVELDKDTFAKVAALRSGSTIHNDAERNAVQQKIDAVSGGLNFVFENYPDLQSHQEIKEAMQQNLYLQREITAARELYNDSVGQWNEDIMKWPVKMMVAAKNQYTTRIPFTASKEVKIQARSNFFN